MFRFYIIRIFFIVVNKLKGLKGTYIISDLEIWGVLGIFVDLSPIKQ